RMANGLDYMEWQKAAGFASRGRPIFFRTKFITHKGNATLLFRNRMHNDYRMYKFDDVISIGETLENSLFQFVQTFSTRKWNMSSFLEGFSPRRSTEYIRVEDPLGILYVVSILSSYNEEQLKKYIRFAYLHKIPNYHFLKRKYVDFPNRNVSESTQQDDCLSLVIRFFPFLLTKMKKKSMKKEMINWVQATTDMKRALYRAIDESQWMQPYDKV
ncbi:hypothetical protein PMAYCL1PPCAC_18361, partial [Pristionchus mayeri]